MNNSSELKENDYFFSTQQQEEKHANHIALSFPFFYELIWSLVCLYCFFTLVAFAAFVKHDIPVVENAIWLFL